MSNTAMIWYRCENGSEFAKWGASPPTSCPVCRSRNITRIEDPEVDNELLSEAVDYAERDSN